MRKRTPRHGLARWLSKYGLASRADAVRWVREGRVSLNGRVTRDPYRPCRPPGDTILVDRLPLRPTRKVYLAMHKPVGHVTTSRDPEGRPTVYDLLPSGTEKVHAVGRLDADTSGLLLFTNDTDFAASVTEARAGVEKEYVALVIGNVTRSALEKFRSGIVLDGKRTRPARATVVIEEGARTRVAVVLTEGRNRQIRRMWESLRHPVVELKRVRIGSIRLGSLPAGKTRPLSAREKSAFSRS